MRLPDDPETLIALGKLLHRLGRTDEALGRLRVALALRPQDPELKRYVDRLAAGAGSDPTDADELARRFAEEAGALVPAHPPTVAATGDTAVVLLDRRVVRVHKNGLSRTFAQRVVEVLSERGAEDNKEFEVHYTPGSEEVDIRQARIYRRDARGALEVLEATDRSDEDLSEPWYGLYYDNRAEVVRFEGLRAGRRRRDPVRGRRRQQREPDGRLLRRSAVRRRDDPQATLGLHAHRAQEPTDPRQSTARRRASNRRPPSTATIASISFAATDIAKVDAEPAMPGTAETAPYLHVSTYATWGEVGAWYWHLVEDQLAADDDVRRTARGLVTPGMTDEARVRAVYDFVVENTRYVGLEFGIHGYKPYKVTQVLARRFGDCKDKASLLVALLREVGVPADLVLVRTRHGGRLDPAAGVAGGVRSRDRLRAQARSLPRRHGGVRRPRPSCPTEDQGVMVLRVGPAGGPPDRDAGAPGEREPGRAALAGGRRSGGRRAHRRVAHASAARRRPTGASTTRRRATRAERYGRVWDGRFPGRAARLGRDARDRRSRRAGDGARVRHRSRASVR